MKKKNTGNVVGFNNPISYAEGLARADIFALFYRAQALRNLLEDNRQDVVHLTADEFGGKKEDYAAIWVNREDEARHGGKLVGCRFPNGRDLVFQWTGDEITLAANAATGVVSVNCGESFGASISGGPGMHDGLAGLIRVAREMLQMESDEILATAKALSDDISSPVEDIDWSQINQTLDHKGKIGNIQLYPADLFLLVGWSFIMQDEAARQQLGVDEPLWVNLERPETAVTPPMRLLARMCDGTKVGFHTADGQPGEFGDWTAYSIGMPGGEALTIVLPTQHTYDFSNPMTAVRTLRELPFSLAVNQRMIETDGRLLRLLSYWSMIEFDDAKREFVNQVNQNFGGLGRDGQHRTVNFAALLHQFRPTTKH